MCLTRARYWRSSNCRNARGTPFRYHQRLPRKRFSMRLTSRQRRHESGSNSRPAHSGQLRSDRQVYDEHAPSISSLVRCRERLRRRMSCASTAVIHRFDPWAINSPDKVTTSCQPPGKGDCDPALTNIYAVREGRSTRKCSRCTAARKPERSRSQFTVDLRVAPRQCSRP